MHLTSCIIRQCDLEMDKCLMQHTWTSTNLNLWRGVYINGVSLKAFVTLDLEIQIQQVIHQLLESCGNKRKTIVQEKGTKITIKSFINNK